MSQLPRDFMATRDDPWWTADMAARAVDDWQPLLERENCRLPLWLIADLGLLTMRSDVLVRTGEHVPADYVESLQILNADSSVSLCTQMILDAPADLQNQAVRTAIRCICRGLDVGLRPEPGDETPERRAAIVQRLKKLVRKCDGGTMLGATELLQIRAATRLREGWRLLDSYLVDQCLRRWDQAPEHPLRTRSLPFHLLGDKEVSRRSGDTAGYTAVRPRLPNDPIESVLPSDWALVRRSKMAGVDKILNRDTLVFERESPMDLVPQVQTLLAFVIDTAPSLRTTGGHTFDDFNRPDSHVQLIARAKSLVYRLILDAAEQTPFDIMSVDTAVYASNFGTDLPPAATCFDLSRVETVEPGAIVRFDELAPFYFSYSRLQNARASRPKGRWPELSDDPFTFLGGASASVATYTAVLTVLVAPPGRWSRVFPPRSPALRPLEYGRNAVLLVEPDVTGPVRSYRQAAFADMADAALSHEMRFADATDLDVRNAFLDMLLGPARRESRTALNGPILMD